MTPTETSTLLQYAGTAVTGIIATVFIFQKLLVGWKSEKTESSVITLMHTELERMSKQNTNLSVELGKLQEDIISLNKELRNLTNENQQLHNEVASLTGEVTRLHALLQGKV